MSDQITNSEKMMSREDRDWLTLIDHAWFAMTGKPWPPYAARNLPDWRAANMGALFSSITALVKALSDRQHCDMCGGRGIRPCGSEGHPEPCECYDAADELLQQFPALLPLETHPPVCPDPKPTPPPPNPMEQAAAFRRELQSLINRHSKENGCDTPDFILAEYLNDCLVTFDAAVRAREKWYGRAHEKIPYYDWPQGRLVPSPIAPPPAGANRK